MAPSTLPSSHTLSGDSLRHIKVIEKIFFNAGLGEHAPQFFGRLELQLSRSADETMAATNFVRFVEASFSQASILRDLNEHPVLLETLLLIFGVSQFFSDILIRDPELFRWLTTTNILELSKTKEEFFAESRQSIDPFESHARKLNALKRYQRRQMLRIGVRDILGLADLESTTRELSHLADAVVARVGELCWIDLRNQYGGEPKTAWTILALGKLGGEELNYSSDIDIIAVYDTDGKMESSSFGMTCGEFFVRFIEHVVGTLSHPTEEGYFYRVDMRLRPDGKAGALIRSFESAMMYYESRGELWERQMLIKGRHLTGDESFAQKFLAALSPFVYPRTFFQNPIDEISRIKARIETDSDPGNIKLKPGGIRDIEFIVQALQLLNGGKNPDLRTANTLAAIELLCGASLLAEREAARLRQAYIFLRTLEHRLQMLAYTQTHFLPETKRERKKIAARMGLSPERFDKLLEEHFRSVRHVFRAVFTKNDAERGSDIEHFLASKPDSEFSRTFALRYRLSSNDKTLRILRRMAYGTNLLGKKEYPERTRTLFKNIAGALLEEIGASAAPDQALAHCEKIFSSFPSIDVMYSLCSERNFRKSLVDLCARSGMLAKQFALSPPLAETILTGIDSMLSEGPQRPSKRSNLHEWKVQEECRAAVNYLLRDTNESALFRSLSEIASAILSSFYEEERKKLKLAAGVQFCILGLGKLGAFEMNFGSDLDLAFFFKANRKSDAEKCERLAAKIITRCSHPISSGKLYDVDARLRPEGRNAPLAVSEAQYLGYLRQRASLWERQSLTRAHVIAGNHGFAEDIMASIRTSIYSSPLPEGWTRQIAAMRSKTESRSRTSAELIDIKLGRGGLMDAEFAVQALQLSRGMNAFPSTNMYELLDFFSNGSPISDTIGALQNNYSLLRRVETAMRLGLDVNTHIIPADDEQLTYLSRLLHFTSAAEFLASLRSSMKETRRLFESILASLE